MTRTYDSALTDTRALEVGHDMYGGLRFLTRSRAAPPPDTGVYLDKEALRALRDQINEFLGDEDLLKEMDEILERIRVRNKELTTSIGALLVRVNKPPVGTIVVGEGLTDAQKLNPPDLEALRLARNALSGFSWLATQEGRLFWETLDHRIANMIACVENRKPVRADVASFSVQFCADRVSITKDAYGTSMVTPAQARELASALNKHADAAEK